MEPDTLCDIEFPDVVTVRRDRPSGWLTEQNGFRIGEWYVIKNCAPDAIGDPDTNFDVGHQPTGMKLCGGLTFWEARRIVMAMDDAGLEIAPLACDMEHDIALIVESIIASALMDHYVFPLNNYFAGVS